MVRKLISSILAGALVIAGAGCDKTPPSQGDQTAPQPQPSAGWQLWKSPTPPPPASIWKEFSGEKAFAHVKTLVELGPHPSGSAELQKARDYIIANLKQYGWEVQQQRFEDSTPRGRNQFVNLIARFAGDSKPVSASTQTVIVSSHYDTKIFDTIRFVGASDGGSSTGALIELARVLAMDPAMARKIELVFFDGEEAVSQFSETDGLYGSRYYAKDLRQTGRNTQFKSGVLWDMIGDKDLTITLSPDSPSELAKGILNAATTLNLRDYFSYFDRNIYDDHVPLIEAGIPTIDLIDFDYIYWHTADDTLDKLSPQSLQKVGSVTLCYLRKAMFQ